MFLLEYFGLIYYKDYIRDQFKYSVIKNELYIVKDLYTFSTNFIINLKNGHVS